MPLWCRQVVGSGILQYIVCVCLCVSVCVCMLIVMYVCVNVQTHVPRCVCHVAWE